MPEYINSRSKLLQHLDRLQAIKQGEHPAPVNVEIDLSNRCNLKCQGCHMAYTHNGKLMDTDLAINILKQLKEIGVRSITWTGGGEPSLHPDIIKIIKACEIDQGIYTNGTLMTAELASILKRKMKWVYISLDRADSKSYLEYKLSGLFQYVIDNAKRLVDAKGDATVGIGFLLDESNWQSHPEMIFRACRQIGADYVQFRPLIVPGANTDWINDALVEINYTSSAVIMDKNRFRMYNEWKGHNYPLCYWAQIQPVITPDGKVWTCVSRRQFSDSELGDLNNDSFANIWARSRAFSVDENCRVMCRGCIANPILNDLFEPKVHVNFI